MNHWSIVTVAFIAVATLPSCDDTSCGTGTVRVQQKDGTLKCVPVDVAPDGIACDVDGGAAIVGGKCVSAISCGPDTKLQNGECVPTGSGGGSVPTCANPSSGSFCVNGALVDFVTNMPVAGTMHVKVYDPVTFLSGGAPLSEADFSGGGFLFQNVPPPPLGLVAIAVGDADGKGATYVTCATGTQNVTAGNKYRVDGYVLPRTVVDGWGGGTDWFASGGYVARFYSDPQPPDTLMQANETHPVAGVMLTEYGAVPAGVKYFGASLTAIDASLTATSAIGAAILPAPGGSSFPTFGGTGGGITWGTQPGGSAARVIFVARFHPGM